MSAAGERNDLHTERLEAFRGCISQITTACHVLVENELFGAGDEVGRFVQALEKQYRVLADAPLEAVARDHPGYKGRRIGIDIKPGSAKLARTEAGLSLRQVAEGHLTAPAIFLVERGKVRPSWRTLNLIAHRTGKPLDFFLADTRWNQYVALEQSERDSDSGQGTTSSSLEGDAAIQGTVLAENLARSAPAEVPA